MTYETRKNDAQEINALVGEIRASYRNRGLKREFNRAFRKLVHAYGTRIESLVLRHMSSAFSADLCRSAAMEGLLNAALKFDSAQASFNTYAERCMVYSILSQKKAENTSYGVSHYTWDNICRIRKVEEKTLMEKGPEMTWGDVFHNSGMKSTTSFRDSLCAMDFLSPVSLDTPIKGDEESRTLMELIEDEDLLDPALVLEKKDMEEALALAMDSLTEKDRLILSMSFGLGGYRVYSNKEICAAVGLSEPTVIAHRRASLQAISRQMESWAA